MLNNLINFFLVTISIVVNWTINKIEIKFTVISTALFVLGTINYIKNIQQKLYNAYYNTHEMFKLGQHNCFEYNNSFFRHFLSNFFPIKLVLSIKVQRLGLRILNIQPSSSIFFFKFKIISIPELTSVIN